MLTVIRLLTALPSWMQWLLTGGRHEIDGQQMDGPSQILNALIVKSMKPLRGSDPVKVRAEMARMQSSRPKMEVSSFEDRKVPADPGSIRVRVCAPDGATGPLPALVWFHGGGWVLGDLAGYDYPCSCLAARSGCAVVSVEYRLAPEHPYPAAIDDCYAAFQHVVANAADFGIDPARIAVGGDSAGGNLAACVSLRAELRAEPLPAFQLLVYPVTDISRESAAYELFREGFLLSTDSIRWFIDQYVPDPEQRADSDVSPLLAGDVSGQPPAHVVVAGFDPLRDDGRAYAAKLEDAGVAVTVDEQPSTFHGFFGMGFALPVADTAVSRAAKALRDALG